MQKKFGTNKEAEEAMTIRTGNHVTIWGRANSVNVQKVLWCCEEIGLDFERIDAGLSFGRNTEPAYMAMNPNGRVPTLVDGDFVLWESNTILRYLVARYAREDALYPGDLRQRATVDKWLDWTTSSYAPVERDLYWGIVRTPAERRDLVAMQKIADRLAALWRVFEKDLDGRDHMASEAITIADICLGAYARRWFGLEEIAKPALPRFEAWFERIKSRNGFQRYLTAPMT